MGAMSGSPTCGLSKTEVLRPRHGLSGPRRSAFRDSRAFTLMEVLVVIALLAIVATLATVDFGALLDNAARSTPLESLTAALENGRERALNSGGPVRLAYDAATATLRV